MNYPSSRWRLRIFGATWLAYAGFYLCRKNFSVVMPLLTDEFGYTKTDLAWLLTGYSLVYMLGQLVHQHHLVSRVGLASRLSVLAAVVHDRGAAATAAGVINGMGSIGQLISPLLVAYVAETMGWNSLFYLFVAFSLISAGLLATKWNFGGRRSVVA